MKKTVAVIFGGTNTEHEVSIVSARSVIDHLDREKYDVLPVYITKTNQWAQLAPHDAAALPATIDHAIIPTDLPNRRVDVVFPMIHGPYGEDGTIQGMLEMLHLPYVGSGVLGSAVCMDKVIQKQLCVQRGLPITPFVWADHYHWERQPDVTLQYVRNKLHYPLFVKPANQGSSVGITKVHAEAELEPAISEAFRYDSKIIIEQGVPDAREIECSVLGNHDPKASTLGEIIPSNEFYDYDAKYVDGKSEAVIPADLPVPVAAKIQEYAVKAFKTLNCFGLVRADFLVNRHTYDIFLNEFNTMPGFTTISMYPKLWQASGMTFEALLDTLIDLAVERAGEVNQRQLSYTPKLPWHAEQ